MTREERVKKYGSFLHCPTRGIDCMAHDYMGDGTCQRAICVLDDPEHIAKEQAIEKRRQELYEKHKREKVEEQEAQKNIRNQNNDTWLENEINKKRKLMDRYYTAGKTKIADKISRELAELERRRA